MKKIIMAAIAPLLSACIPQWDGYSDIKPGRGFGVNPHAGNGSYPKAEERLYRSVQEECRIKRRGLSEKQFNDCVIEGVWKYNNMLSKARLQEIYMEQRRHSRTG